MMRICWFVECQHGTAADFGGGTQFGVPPAATTVRVLDGTVNGTQFGVLSECSRGVVGRPHLSLVSSTHNLHISLECTAPKRK